MPLSCLTSMCGDLSEITKKEEKRKFKSSIWFIPGLYKDILSCALLLIIAMRNEHVSMGFRTSQRPMLALLTLVAAVAHVPRLLAYMVKMTII